MKKTLLSLIAIFAFIMLGQAQEDQQAGKTGISKAEMQSRVEESVGKSIREGDIEETQEAIAVLQKTRDVLALIAQNKIKEAEDVMAEIVGKLDIILAKRPDLALIPVSSTVEVHDVVADLETVEKIMKQVRAAIDKGYYQQAKRVLSDLSSEIIIKTAYLPMATYPDAMKLAAKLLDEGKTREAATVLVQALNTLVIKEDIIPLPVLRAQEYIRQALLVLDNEKTFKENKEVLLALLDAADYQLKLAEAMGYGKRDKEYKELALAIEQIKKYVEKERERKTRKALTKLEEKLKNFKERLFPVKPQK
ncbi:MAG: YfdX family protein [Chlorobi bacterium]|nr:YfdX family protein [Chlorobiota bacterium]